MIRTCGVLHVRPLTRHAVDDAIRAQEDLAQVIPRELGHDATAERHGCRELGSVDPTLGCVAIVSRNEVEDLEEVVASRERAVSRLPPRDRPQLALQLGLEGFRAHEPAGGIIGEALSDGAEEGALVVLIGLRGTLVDRGFGGDHPRAA